MDSDNDKCTFLPNLFNSNIQKIEEYLNGMDSGVDISNPSIM